MKEGWIGRVNRKEGGEGGGGEKEWAKADYKKWQGLLVYIHCSLDQLAELLMGHKESTAWELTLPPIHEVISFHGLSSDSMKDGTKE